MIHEVMLRWVVTGLFAFSAAECVPAILNKHRQGLVVVNHGLHFLMAVAMAAMAWPWSTRFPTIGPAVFFLLATLWFVAIAIVAAPSATQRGLYGYHGLMMLAMVWMYAAMDDRLLPIHSSTQRPPEPSMSMPDTGMATMNMPPSSGSPLWVNALNWFGTVGFAAAAAYWTYRYVIDRRHRASPHRSLGNVGQATMAAGMAVLFAAALFRI